VSGKGGRLGTGNRVGDGVGRDGLSRRLARGLRDVPFLLAVFQDATNPTTAAFSAVLGLVCAVLISFALYRGGARINLSRFFRFTGIVLVFVAAGLLATAALSLAPATSPSGSP